MKMKILKVIFTNKKLDWSDLKKRNWDELWALHLEVEDIKEEGKESQVQTNEYWKIVSRFFDTNDKEQFIKDNIIVWRVYDLNFSYSWQWKNLINIKTLEGKLIV